MIENKKIAFKRKSYYLFIILIFCILTQSYSFAQMIVKNTKNFTAKNVINVKDAGAKGDGIHDDTEAIKKIFSNITAKNTKVFFPSGIYKITQTISLPSHVKLQGTGDDSCLIMGKSLKNGIFSAFSQENITIVNLSFEGTNTNLNQDSTERILFFDKCLDIKIEGCNLSKTIIAIQGQGCINMSVANCYIHDIKHRSDFSQGYGILFNLSSSNVVAELNRFYKIGRHAVYISSGTSNAVIRKNLVDGCESCAIGVYSKSTQKASENVEILENNIRNVNGHVSPRGISIAVFCKNIIISKNILHNIQQYGIAIEGGALEYMEHNPSNIIIVENAIGDCRDAGIWVVNASGIKVQKNNINAVFGIVAKTAGKFLVGSYLKQFSALNNEITYEKYGIIVSGGLRVNELLLKENIFKSGSEKTHYKIE